MERELPTIVLAGLEGNVPPTLSLTQQFLAAHLSTLEVVYWCLWIATLAFVLLKYGCGIDLFEVVKKQWRWQK